MRVFHSSLLMVSLAAVLASTSFSFQVEPAEHFVGESPVSPELVLDGEQNLQYFAGGMSLGFAFFQPSAIIPGDYTILTSPIGSGYAALDTAVPGHYVLTFASGTFDMYFDGLQGAYYIDVGGELVYLTGNPDNCTVVPGVMNGPNIKVECVVVQGRQAKRIQYRSGEGLFGVPVELFQTTKVGACYDHVDQGVTHTDVPVPPCSIVKSTGNGGNFVKADCSTVYCSAKTPGDGSLPITSWAAGGGMYTEAPLSGPTPNFANRIAMATGHSPTKLTIKTTYTTYICIGGFAAFRIEATATQCTTASSGWMPSGPTEWSEADVTVPMGFMMDADDAAAIASFAGGNYMGAPAQ